MLSNDPRIELWMLEQGVAPDVLQACRDADNYSKITLPPPAAAEIITAIYHLLNKEQTK